MRAHIERWQSLTLSPADRAILDQMEEEMDGERIIAAAMIYKGVMATLPPPNRHSDIIHAIALKVPEAEWPISGLGGFWTSESRFVNRADGMLIAKRSGQVSEAHDSATLYTEDLW